VKREMLERLVADDPTRMSSAAGCSRSVCRTRSSTAPGAVQAMALEILHEWRLTRNVAAFNDWLARGAPSDDRVGDRT
jgi:hypothetical protein